MKDASGVARVGRVSIFDVTECAERLRLLEVVRELTLLQHTTFHHDDHTLHLERRHSFVKAPRAHECDLASHFGLEHVSAARETLLIRKEGLQPDRLAHNEIGGTILDHLLRDAIGRRAGPLTAREHVQPHPPLGVSGPVCNRCQQCAPLGTPAVRDKRVSRAHISTHIGKFAVTAAREGSERFDNVTHDLPRWEVMTAVLFGEVADVANGDAALESRFRRLFARPVSAEGIQILHLNALHPLLIRGRRERQSVELGFHLTEVHIHCR
mmetsp:Transcript_48391/g.80283  ORF Transcript_48391/g.80283 Transcript_48391/m.80283 type:complete len:268 (-) Transcript_48391:2339-3142(-)